VTMTYPRHHFPTTLLNPMMVVLPWWKFQLVVMSTSPSNTITYPNNRNSICWYIITSGPWLSYWRWSDVTAMWNTPFCLESLPSHCRASAGVRKESRTQTSFI
jgi:hypothetical protein